jgi:hypothetical protein
MNRQIRTFHAATDAVRAALRPSKQHPRPLGRADRRPFAPLWSIR